MKTANVTIVTMTSDRGVSMLVQLTLLIESVIAVESCEIDHTRSNEATFIGTTNIPLSELSASLYSNSIAAKLLRRVSYHVEKTSIAGVLGATRELPDTMYGSDSLDDDDS